MSGDRPRPEPPSGHPPPTSASIGDGPPLDLAALAREICRRYRDEYPDEQERYGDAGMAWCVHDNQHILNWAAGSVNGYVDLQQELSWLARILESRDFPLDRYARNMDIAADVITDREPRQTELVGALRDAATFVRDRGSFVQPS